MKLDWLEDLVAVLESSSLNEAAKRRFLTQPAFSRRIRALENYVGVELFDRSRKPLTLKRSVHDNADELRRLVVSLRQLTANLKEAEPERRALVLSCQHAISTTLAPRLIDAVSKKYSRVRLRSANKDQCLTLLLTGESDIAVTYEIASEGTRVITTEPNTDSHTLVEQRLVTKDRLVPVVSQSFWPEFEKTISQGRFGIVFCPPEGFLGRVLTQRLLPELGDHYEVDWTVETALTTALLRLVLSGAGVGWLPYSLAQNELEAGELVNLDQRLPSIELDVVASIRKNESDVLVNEAWSGITGLKE